MIISFSQLGNHGRLANQLFQIAGVLGLAEKHKAQAQFPLWQYEDCFHDQLPHGSAAPYQLREEHFHHYDWNITRDTDILGYLQSEKYFPSRKPLQFKRTYLQEVKLRALVGSAWKKETIAIHVRRGDYVGNPNYYQLPITYFINTLALYFPDWQEKNIIVLSDDLEYCRLHFGSLDNVYFEDDNHNLSEIQALALGSLCDHFILSNSSFSWWMAYLGEKKHSRVIYPAHHFAGRLLEHDIKDFWPERWTKYEGESYKLDLMDTTFTIPVYFDHKDRKQNLDLSVCMLQHSFLTNIIVGECKSYKFEYIGQYVDYIYFQYRQFHRTKMLNEMAKRAKTAYIVNWDADVFITPMQIYLTVLKLRAGADMVFPYDGRFARWERVPWFRELEKNLDLGIFKGITPVGSRGKSIEDMYSVGGAVFFNKNSFIAGGMENEKMISFGPEDCERNDRFTMLGFKIERAKGYLHHINHWCGPDSNKFNVFFKANHEEIDRIRRMDKNQLTAYIKTWPWLKQ